MKIAMAQIAACTDKARNLAKASEAIKHASQKGAQLVVLPVLVYVSAINSKIGMLQFTVWCEIL